MRMGWRDGRGRQGGQGSCWERGGTWLGLPKLLHSPNFQRTLGTHLPKTENRNTSSGRRTSSTAGAGRLGGREPPETDATFPVRKPHGRTAVRTQLTWAGVAAREGGAEAPASLYAAVGLGVWWLHVAERQEERERERSSVRVSPWMQESICG